MIPEAEAGGDAILRAVKHPQKTLLPLAAFRGLKRPKTAFFSPLEAVGSLWNVAGGRDRLPARKKDVLREKGHMAHQMWEHLIAALLSVGATSKAMPPSLRAA